MSGRPEEIGHRIRVLFKIFKYAALAALAGIFACAIFIGYLSIARRSPLELPVPTGAYPVGRAEFDLTDASRLDPLADQGSSPRELVVWVWYPAAQAGSVPAPYLPAFWAQAHDQDQGIGVLIEHDFSRIQTHSYEEAALAVAPQAFPVLVMEPGLGPMATDYTAFAENLASHGYIVAGINPTDSANWTVFPDGRTVLRTAKGNIPDNDTPAALNADASRILAVWAQDEQFVMDQLAIQNTSASSPFHNRMDLDRIGLWGHSFGGAAAVAVCQVDPRCKAGVDMDGTPWGRSEQMALSRPFMFLTEDYSGGCDRNCAEMRQVFLHTEPGEAYFLSVAGAQHFNFSDLPYRQIPVVRPLFTLFGYDGTIQPARGLQIGNAYLVAFFDHYLKGSPEALLGGPSPTYPEVSFEMH